MSETAFHKPMRLMLGVFVALILVGMAAVALDWRQLHRVLRQADWGWVAVALGFTAISYLCLSYGFAIACRVFGIGINQRELLEVGFISNVLNNLMTSGGAAGYSLRLLVMRQRGQSISDIMAASLFHSYFNTLALLTLLPIGLTHLLATHSLAAGEIAGIAGVVLIAALALILASAVMFSSAVRIVVFKRLSAAVRRLTHRDPAPSLAGFDTTMTRGVAAIRQRPARLVVLLALVMTDWISSLIALGFCFDALGDWLKPGVLLTGFAVGVAVGLVSMVPGGLGVQDSSMAGIYALLGVPLEKAVLAAVLFRVVYYLIPFGVSLLFYWGLLRRLKKEQQPHA
jgi:uncharacterized protein (TIRG00374 family)